MQSQKKHPQNLSFEFFPPKTAPGLAKLIQTNKQLLQLNPSYVSVTFGAGGALQENTAATVAQLKETCDIDVIPHISCAAMTSQRMTELLDYYHNHGIKQLVVLRGDATDASSDFAFANDLVAYIRQTTGDYFHIKVAAYPESHPQAENLNKDLAYFKRKITAGANAAITQYFYNPDAYFHYIDACEQHGIDIPIVPGIMPITNYQRLISISKRCSAEIPRWLCQKLLGFGEDTVAMQKFGIEVITKLCEKLLAAGAPGLHFYSLNKIEPSMEICRNLGF